MRLDFVPIPALPNVFAWDNRRRWSPLELLVIPFEHCSPGFLDISPA